MRNELLSLLHALDGIWQSPVFHPEGDALFHTLQVFERALADTRDPILLAAALFHDVGKALDGPSHEIEGAWLLEGLAHPDVVFLVEHHLDLLRDPRETRRRFANSYWLPLLERLRRYDLAGRDPRARVRSPEWALDTLLSLATLSSDPERSPFVIASAQDVSSDMSTDESQHTESTTTMDSSVDHTKGGHA
jgi:hypothetical protein